MWWVMLLSLMEVSNEGREWGLAENPQNLYFSLWFGHPQPGGADYQLMSQPTPTLPHGLHGWAVVSPPKWHIWAAG